MNLLLEIVRDLPLRVHLMWAAWLVGGVLLVVWHIRDRGAEQTEREEAARAKARTKSSGSRPAATVNTVSTVSAVNTVRPVKAAPVPPEDAFAELEAMLQPITADAGGSSRRPGE